MKTYELIEHVADVRLKITADSIEELFKAGLLGMANLIKTDVCQSSGTQILTIELQAPDTTSLLIDFLGQALVYTHIRKVIYCDATFEKLTDTSLRATLTGSLVEDFEEDVKAVTYHEAEVKRNPQGLFETIIIFDI